MKKCFQVFIILMITFIFIQCAKDFGILSPNLLQYEIMNGWTGKISKITVFRDYSAVKNMENLEEQIEFTSGEREKLKAILSEYSSFKRYYKPENGFWADLSTHELIYYQTHKPDSVSVYEPLSTPEIPNNLVELIDILTSKL